MGIAGAASIADQSKYLALTVDMLEQNTKATDVCKSSYTNDESRKQLEYTIVHWLRGVKPYEWRSQALADPAVSFEVGDLTKRPKPGYPQN